MSTGQCLTERLLEGRKNAMFSRGKFRLLMIGLFRAETQNEATAIMAFPGGNSEPALPGCGLKIKMESLRVFGKMTRPGGFNDPGQGADFPRQFLPLRLAEEELLRLVCGAVAETGAAACREKLNVTSLLVPLVKVGVGGVVVCAMVG